MPRSRWVAYAAAWCWCRNAPDGRDTQGYRDSKSMGQGVVKVLGACLAARARVAGAAGGDWALRRTLRHEYNYPSVTLRRVHVSFVGNDLGCFDAGERVLAGGLDDRLDIPGVEFGAAFFQRHAPGWWPAAMIEAAPFPPVRSAPPRRPAPGPR